MNTRPGLYLVYEAGRQVSEPMRCLFDWVMAGIATDREDGDENPLIRGMLSATVRGRVACQPASFCDAR